MNIVIIDGYLLNFRTLHRIRIFLRKTAFGPSSKKSSHSQSLKYFPFPSTLTITLLSLLVNHTCVSITNLLVISSLSPSSKNHPPKSLLLNLCFVTFLSLYHNQILGQAVLCFGYDFLCVFLDVDICLWIFSVHGSCKRKFDICGGLPSFHSAYHNLRSCISYIRNKQTMKSSH